MTFITEFMRRRLLGQRNKPNLSADYQGAFIHQTSNVYLYFLLVGIVVQAHTSSLYLDRLPPS
jgi:hypothetical protein